MADRLYLDHAATTPMLPEATAAVLGGMGRWANPSSPHAEGRAARAALEAARDRIKAALEWTGELILTSGASEAIALALRGADPNGATASATEHDAVLRAMPGRGRVPVDGDGRVSTQAGRGICTCFDPDDACDLFAIQSANSETGVLQPLGAVRERLRRWEAESERRMVLLSDCSQSAGKLPLPDADLIVVSAHKLGGPPGVGALLVRDLALLRPSGGQEQGYRGGTENLPGALGFAAALEAPRDWFARAAELRARCDAGVRAAGGTVIADNAPRIPTIAAYRMPGVSAAAQLMRFDLAGIALSAGSACSSGTLKASHVLSAMGMAPADAGEVVRVSFGWTTCADDVERFLHVWRAIAASARSRAA